MQPKLPRPQWNAANPRSYRWVIVVVGILAVVALPVACFQSVFAEPWQCKNILAKGSLIHVGQRDYRYHTENFAMYVTDGRGKLAGWIYTTQETKEEFFQPKVSKSLVRIRPQSERLGTTFEDETAFLKQRSLQPDFLTACGFAKEEKTGGFTFGGSNCHGAYPVGRKLVADGHVMQVRFITPVTDAKKNLKGWIYTPLSGMRYVFVPSDGGVAELVPDQLLAGEVPYTDPRAFVKQRFGDGADEKNCGSAFQNSPL